MIVGISALVIIIVAFLILKFIVSISLKIIGFGILIVLAALTIWICSEQPQMHKPFSLNTIEYLFKINKDGSMTTTKQVTTTVMRDGSEVE